MSECVVQEPGTGGAVPTNLTPNRAVVTDGMGALTVSPVTDVELASLIGITGNVQSQFDSLTSANIGDFVEAAQDAVGSILAGTATIDLTYTDATPQITAALVPASINNTHVAAGAAISRTKLASGTPNYFVVNNAAGQMSEVPSFVDLSVRGAVQDEFIGAVTSYALGWGNDTTGTNASISAVAPIFQNNWGLVQLSTGTTASGRASLFLSPLSLVFGGAAGTYSSYIYVPTLSDATNSFKIYIGFGDNTGAGDMIDGVYFSYNHAESGGNWQLNTASNSARIFVNSGVVVASSSFVRLSIGMNSSGSLATFLVNGIQVGTISTNIPTLPGRETGVIFKAEKLVGTGTARTLVIDYMQVVYFPNTVR